MKRAPDRRSPMRVTATAGEAPDKRGESMALSDYLFVVARKPVGDP